MPKPSLARVHEVFVQALDVPPDQLDSFLEATCTEDDALREKVEELPVRILLCADQEGQNRVSQITPTT